MNNQIPLVMDNMVYSLQRTGGGSIYWKYILEGSVKDPRFSVKVIERGDVNNNITWDSSLSYPTIDFIGNKLPLRVDEVLSPNVSDCVFHSSYFRTSKGSNSLNVTTIFDFISQYYFKGFVKSFSLWQMKKAVKHSDVITCISHSTKKDLLKFIPEAKDIPIKVIHLAQDANFQYKECPRKDQVCFIGARQQNYKNFKFAVDVVSKLKDIKLVVIGSKLTDEETTLLADKLGSRYESVVFPSSEEISKIYNESKALLYLSSYEGFGLPVLEAMASGLPVVCLNSSSIPEIAGDAGLMLDKLDMNEAVDKIKSILDDSSFFSSVVEAGLKNAKNFSWDKTTGQTLKLYEDTWNRNL
ncbi:MAG: glycosyltransferase family 4 protein [Streptococcus gallolyticus]|nr:glycosyltransferase family 4 protein [Streptococcus gallolyticus]